MKKESESLIEWISEQTVLARERTFYTQEMTFLALVRTVVIVMAFLIFIGEMVVPNYLNRMMLLLLLSLIGLIVVVETLFKFHKAKEKLKTLEERINT